LPGELGAHRGAKVTHTGAHPGQRSLRAVARVRCSHVQSPPGRVTSDWPRIQPLRPYPRNSSSVPRVAREAIDVALLGIREELDDLRATPTLLRMLKDERAVPVVASLAIAGVMLDLVAFGAAVASSTGVAAFAREVLAHREIKRRARQQPFWYLREVNRLLARR
jgi:hypothetical protein